MNINKELDKLSILMHQRTGYSIRHAILEMRDNSEYSAENMSGDDNEIRQSCADFCSFNSDEWTWFLDLINEACK